jgi:predicted ArsR family transcriptional regulator
MPAKLGDATLPLVFEEAAVMDAMAGVAAGAEWAAATLDAWAARSAARWAEIASHAPITITMGSRNPAKMANSHSPACVSLSYGVELLTTVCLLRTDLYEANWINDLSVPPVYGRTLWKNPDSTPGSGVAINLSVVGETSSTDSAVHRALSDESRRAIVAELRTAPGDGLDAHELAERVGLHSNTVRFHLAVLADAGLVEGTPAARSTPGRPRIVYTLTRAVGAEARRNDEYRLLASILNGALANNAEAAELARGAGREWGRYLTTGPAPFTRTSDEESVAIVAALLDDQGFEPVADGGTICMRRCPFKDLAESHPEVICAAHRGLIEGALEELQSDLEVAELEIFPTPDVCIVRLGASATSY